MKNLIVIRHAKSSWEAPLLDQNRPISVRGIHDAQLISSKLNELLPQHFVIWSSIAKRAVETAGIFIQNLVYPAKEIVYKPELYTFEMRQLERAIKACDNDCDTLIVFCHNEAVTDFVNKFGDQKIENIPTTGLVSLMFDSDSWDAIRDGKIKQKLFPTDFKNK